MTIIVNGALGRMGQQVCRILAESGDTAVKVDKAGGESVFSSLAEYTGPADAVIDFSNHAGAKELADYCVSRKLPLVAATTGYTPEELALLEQAAETVPVFQSFNMSIGVALLARLVKQAAAVFGGADAGRICKIGASGRGVRSRKKRSREALEERDRHPRHPHGQHRRRARSDHRNSERDGHA